MTWLVVALWLIALGLWWREVRENKKLRAVLGVAYLAVLRAKQQLDEKFPETAD